MPHLHLTLHLLSLCRHNPFRVHTCVIRTRLPRKESISAGSSYQLSHDCSHLSDLWTYAIVSGITSDDSFNFSMSRTSHSLRLFNFDLSSRGPVSYGSYIGWENVEFATRGRNGGMKIPDLPKEEVKFRSRGRILIGFAFESLSLSLSLSLSFSLTPSIATSHPLQSEYVGYPSQSLSS